jgi:uncharacterized protein YcbK (DUF882 family)
MQMIVRSAYRSLEHNRAIGGATASNHSEGIDFDIAIPPAWRSARPSKKVQCGACGGKEITWTILQARPPRDARRY